MRGTESAEGEGEGEQRDERKPPTSYHPLADDLRRRPPHVEIPFATRYHLHKTHMQRLATEYRVPLFEGFTMPSAMHDAEVAAMFKQLLLRSMTVKVGAEAGEERLLDASASLCMSEDHFPPIANRATPPTITHLPPNHHAHLVCHTFR